MNAELVHGQPGLRGTLLAIVTAILLWPAQLSVADSPQEALPSKHSPAPSLEVEMLVVQDQLTLNCELGSLLEAPLRERLQDGLTHRVGIQISLVSPSPDGSAEFISRNRRRCELIYDLWGERYALRLLGESTPRERWSEDLQHAAAWCGRFSALKLSPMRSLDLRRRYRVELRIVVDPARDSSSGAAEARRADPFGGPGSTRPGGTLFGAMARAFYRSPGKHAGQVIELSSAEFGDALLEEALQAGSDEDPSSQRPPDRPPPEAEPELHPQAGPAPAPQTTPAAPATPAKAAPPKPAPGHEPSAKLEAEDPVRPTQGAPSSAPPAGQP